MTLYLSVHPPLISLAPCSETQVAYGIVAIRADAGIGPAPIHWAVIADVSRSMRIPIVSEEQFRDLVRHGGAYEVLVDGMPVWQLSDPVPETLRASVPSALDYTARALHSVVERLDQRDSLCLVACAEQARLLEAADGAHRAALAAGIARLHTTYLGEATDLAAGLRLALDVLSRADSRGYGRRIILLTDGFTRDAEACIALARTAAAQGISVSTLGLGGEFQDALLTRLADLSGGRATFVRRPEQIPAAVAAELEAARRVVAHALTLELRLPQRVALRHVTRLSPYLTPLEWESEADGRSLRLHLGDLEHNAPIRLLLELLGPPLSRLPPGGTRLRLAVATARVGDTEARAEILAHYYDHHPGAPPPDILAAANRASIARLQRRAAAAVANGDPTTAVGLLRTAAARLHDLGEHELALAALREAEALATTGRDTGLGARELTYATRRLGVDTSRA